MNYYETLGVSKSSSQAEIKRRYRQLARDLHPDLNQGDRVASNRFKKVNEAYEVLSSVKKREDYDQFGDNWKHAEDLRKMGPGRRNSFTNFGDIFGNGFSNSDTFGGMFNHQPGRKSEKLMTTDVNISLKEAFTGTLRRFTISGRGSDDKNIEVNIPPGVTDGKIIRLRPKDLVLDVKIHLQKDSIFTVDGKDIRSKFNVSLFDAILGSEVTVNTIDGKISLFIPPGTPNGKTFRLSGKGMPSFKGNSRGDMFTTIEVNIPRDFSEVEIEEIKKMKAKRQDSKKVDD